jgi:hypothetical protein
MASDIVQIREMRQPGGIRYASLDTQWAGTFPLPAVGGNVEFPIAAPKPDLTIGYNEKVIMKVSDAKEYLGDQCLPLKTDKNLLFPVVTGEVESMLAEEYAQRRNMHNSAMMLRNLRTLRRCAGMPEALLETVFDNIAHVLTISFTRAQIILHCCWTQLGPDDLLGILLEAGYFVQPHSWFWSLPGYDEQDPERHRLGFEFQPRLDRQGSSSFGREGGGARAT